MITYARKRRASSTFKAEQPLGLCRPCQTAGSAGAGASLSSDISQAVNLDGAWTIRHQAGQVAKRTNQSRQQSWLALGNWTNATAGSTKQVNMFSRCPSKETGCSPCSDSIHKQDQKSREWQNKASARCFSNTPVDTAAASCTLCGRQPCTGKCIAICCLQRPVRKATGSQEIFEATFGTLGALVQSTFLTRTKSEQ